jgi:hypothetical protein
MQHFSEQPLVDFVRGVSRPQIRGDIRTHLGAGCPKCQTALDAWRKVGRLAAQESAYAPPENLVRVVKLGFAGKAVNQAGVWSLANLVFDSFAQPLPAGVRSGALHVWQVIYEGEGLTVDLRFGHREHSREVHLVGQVLDRKEVRAWKNATVEVSTAEDKMVAAAAVNASGEFHLEFEAGDRLGLSVKAEGRDTVRIPLTNPTQR